MFVKNHFLEIRCLATLGVCFYILMKYNEFLMMFTKIMDINQGGKCKNMLNSQELFQDFSRTFFTIILMLKRIFPS